MKKSGFTLAEVLITLVIIGVIAAMTIPTLLSNTGKQETKTALKKAMSVINQAITLNYALTGNEMSSIVNDQTNLNELMYKRLSILKSSGKTFYTADGIIYDFNSATAACAEITQNQQTPSGACILTIDINGDKGPNMYSGGRLGGSDISSDAAIETTGGIRDKFKFYILPQRVVPGEAAKSILADDEGSRTENNVSNSSGT